MTLLAVTLYLLGAVTMFDRFYTIGSDGRLDPEPGQSVREASVFAVLWPLVAVWAVALLVAATVRRVLVGKDSI